MSIAVILRPAMIVACAALMAGCLSSESLESFAGPAMGSSYSVKYVRTAATPALARLQEGIEGILAEIDVQMSTYREDSLLEGFNRAPAGTCQAMPEAVLELVRVGEQLNHASAGAFDLTLDPLLKLWGFGPRGQDGQVPDEQAIAEAREHTGHQFLSIEGEQLCKSADVQLDFNSLAAGHAVDRMAGWLEAQGVTRYLVEATGELKARGRKPDGSAWRIAVEAPRDDQRVAQRILALDGLGVSTSGDYRNYFERDGRRYSHTLDPRSGRPISHTLASVSVVHAQTLQADALSTLLMVLGPEQGMAYAEREGLAALFVQRVGEGFVTQASPAFDALFPAQEETP